MPLQPPSPFHQHIALPERTALLLSMLAPWPRRGRELLVIGCGGGHVLPPLWQSGFDLSACEASPALREQARHRAPQGVEIEAAAPDWLPFADNSFDWVLLRADELPPAALPRGGLRPGPHLLEQRVPALADLAPARASPCLARAFPALLDSLAPAGRPSGTTARGKLPLAARLPLASRDEDACRGPFPPALRGLVRPASGHGAPPYGHAPAPAPAPPTGYFPPRHGV